MIFKTALSLGALLVILYLSAMLYLVINERNFLYYPPPSSPHGTPELAGFELENQGETSTVWQLNPGQPNAILYFGGNAEYVAWRASLWQQLLPDYTIYLLNYPGFGPSSGQPTEQGIYAAALALFDKVSPEHQYISSIGLSLGSGVATYLAKQRELQQLVLITPFDSAAAVAQRHYPMFPVRLLMRDRFDSISRVSELQLPTLIVIAANDTLIPPSHAENLAQAFDKTTPKVITIADTHHGNITQHHLFAQALSNFFSRANKTQ